MKDNDKQSGGTRLSCVVACSMSAAGLFAFGVQAQEGGALATFGLSFGGQYTANDPGEDESELTNRLSFDLSSVTPTQTFELSADGALVFDEDGADFERPGITVGYARENRATALEAGLSYSVRDVEGTVDVIDPITLTVVDLINDDGTLESVTLSAGLETGRDARFGTSTQFSYTDRTYSDTSDPGLTDLVSWQVGTTLRFDLDPRIALSSTASYRETQEDDAEQTESRTTRFGIGGDLLIDPLWSASFNLSYSIFETEEDVAGTRVLTEEDGAGFSLAVTRQFRDGVLGISLARDVSDIGAEDSLRISRNRELADGGELAWSLGLVSSPNGETSPIVSVSYARPTPRGSLFVGLDQTTAVNRDDESVISTSVDFGYEQAINATSGWSLSGSLTNVSVVGENEEGQSRAQVGVAYNHALTQDWSLSAALRHRITLEDGEENDSASTFSLSLGRSFSFRP
jgi:hypothetical protein